MTKTNKANADLQTCELCIIGAGAAGLNALFVASRYLKKTDRVILIERRYRPGGMWTDVYDYARLHQPHPAFTVGDMEWTWSEPKDYLATGSEVASHLQRCYGAIRGKVDLVELFGHTVTACDEITTERGATARVECHASDAVGQTRIIEAKRVINAIGFDVPAARPLAFKSRNVISTTPEQLSRDAGFDASTPVYVVGGGKTGMDTAYNLLTRGPGRPVTLVNGKGTVFVEREMYFPRNRWRKGTLLADLFRDQALLFNGSNEDESFYHLRRMSTVSVGGNSESFFYGILSRRERHVIASGLEGIVRNYLDDVVDGPNGAEMVLRNGVRQPVPAGSVFVNCTGHLLRHHQEYRPYLSAGGAIVSITQRSMVHFLSTASAYFLTHLFFRGQLRDLPLYEFDGEEIISKNPRLYHMSLMCLTFMNQLIMMRALPLSVFTRCGLDIDRLYPLHRRAVALVDLKFNGRRYVAHCMKALDRMRELNGVRCGPLSRSDDLPDAGGRTNTPLHVENLRRVETVRRAA